MTDQTIRVGIIGAGGNTRAMHIPGLRDQPGVEVVAVANRTVESGQRVADEFAIPRVAADWLEIIEQREDYWYHQPPANSERYHRAPGVLRICYPDVQFVGDEAVFAYDFGWGIYGRSMTGTKVRSIPLGYLRGD
ncbi:MAG: Gfo/Idh/MocA family oxidoreductase [Alphaproteobacteria bacterium]|nr:Gfo/Idh/MocA family oxidoreductase [Alphaproteobacteria bacterium]